MQENPHNKAIWKKKNKVGGFTLPNFKFYYKVTVIETMWCLHKNRAIYQWNRIESSKINPYICGQLNFSKVPSPFTGGKKSVLNKWCWENWVSTCKRRKVDRDPLGTPNGSRVHTRTKTIKVIEEEGLQAWLKLYSKA
jgi:hypothetical protein